MIIGLDWIGWDGIGLLDWIIGWFFFTQTLMCPGPQGHSSQGRFFFVLRHIPQNGHKLSKKVISGPEFLKNDDIWSDFIKLDQIGSTLVSAS